MKSTKLKLSLTSVLFYLKFLSIFLCKEGVAVPAKVTSKSSLSHDSTTMSKNNSANFIKEGPQPFCYPVYSSFGDKELQQQGIVTKDEVFHFHEDPFISHKQGKICFTKSLKCQSTKRCIYSQKEFCTATSRASLQTKGTICNNSMTGGEEDVLCGETRFCKSKSLCLQALKLPKGSFPTPTCVCQLGYGGVRCSEIDYEQFEVEILDTVDLRNILLRYQQKDRYFIGVTLLAILVFIILSVLLTVACCTCLFVKLSFNISQIHHLMLLLPTSNNSPHPQQV